MIYIAGKITGEDLEYCKTKFLKVWQYYQTQKEIAYCPIFIAQEIEEKIKGNLENFPSLEYETYLKEDLKYLLDCKKAIFLPDFINSPGALFELEICKKLKIPYEFMDKELFERITQ